MELLRQIQANRLAKGMDNRNVDGSKPTPKKQVKKEKEIKERSTLKEMRADIIDKKPSGSKVKKYFKEVIERLTEESSDDDGI